MFQAAGHRRDLQGARRHVERDFLGLGVEVQGNIQLPGQQVAAAGLGTQAMRDEITQDAGGAFFVIGGMVERLEQLGVGQAQAFGVDHDADVDREGLALFVEVQVYRDHLTDFHAEELHRGIHFQAAHRLLETQYQVLRLAVGRGEGRCLVVEQFEVPGFGGRLVVGVVFRRAKGDTTDQHGRYRLGLDPKAVGTDLQINTADVPETCVLGNKGIIGRIDEHFDIDALAIRGQCVSYHLAHRDLAVVDRRADVQRAEVGGAQHEVLARLFKGDCWRYFLADELLGAFFGLADVGADEVPGQQRVDTGNTAGTNAWSYHPEHRILAGEGLSLLLQLHCGIDAFLVLAECDIADMADDHVAILDLGLVRHQPLAGLEVDGDDGPGLHAVVHHQGDPHQHGDDGYDPYQRDTPALGSDAGLARGRAPLSGFLLHP
ncbi:hypothetical protein D9M71_411540 [compost metagenome]